MKLKVQVPSPNEIVAGLDVESDQGVRTARARLVHASAERDQVGERVTAAGNTVERLRADVGAGKAIVGQLEAALVAQRAAVLTVPGFAEAVEHAESTWRDAIDEAKRRAKKEAGRRRDQLQRIADEIRPVLNALRDAEAALDDVARGLGMPYGVEPVLWPSSLEADGALRNNAIMGTPAA